MLKVDGEVVLKSEGSYPIALSVIKSVLLTQQRFFGETFLIDIDGTYSINGYVHSIIACIVVY